MMIKKIFFLVLALLPTNSFAQDDLWSYSVIASVMKSLKTGSIRIFESLGTAFQELFYILVVVFIVIEACKMMLKKEGQLILLLKMGLVFVFVDNIAFSSKAFQTYFYDPIIESFLYKIPAFIFSVAQGDLIFDNSLSDLEIIKSMINKMDNVIAGIIEVGKSSLGSWGDWLMNPLDSLAVLGVLLIYIALGFAFVILFVIGILACHMFIIFFPIAFCLIAFKQTKNWSFNIFKVSLSYGLMPMFASLAMGFTLSLLGDVLLEANKYLDANKEAIFQNMYLPPNFLMESALIGIISFFIHVKSSQFASQFIGTQISDFGQNFATMTSLGYAGAKTLAMPAMRPATNMVKNALSKGMDGYKNMSQNLKMSSPISAFKSGMSSSSGTNSSSESAINSWSSKKMGQNQLPYNGSKMNNNSDDWKIVGVVPQIEQARKNIASNNDKNLLK